EGGGVTDSQCRRAGQCRSTAVGVGAGESDNSAGKTKSNTIGAGNYSIHDKRATARLRKRFGRAAGGTENDGRIDRVAAAGVFGINRAGGSGAGIRKCEFDIGVRTGEVVTGRRGSREI